MEIISSSPRNIQQKELVHNPKASSPTPPQTPRLQESIRNNSSSYPTTFVQADTSNFKQVVQLLTGTPPRSSGGTTIPPIKTTSQKKQGLKLHERRNSLKNGLMVNTLFGPKSPSQKIEGFSPKLSPSILDFPSLVLSPITPPPFVGEKSSKNHKPSLAETNLAVLEGGADEEERRAIAEKKFYLHSNYHPSPRSKDVEPQLLTLFPLTSPSSSTTTTTC